MIVAADGNSSRFSLALGLHRRENRPMGVAYRRYFESPRHDDNWLESWLELWDRYEGKDRLLPGYGWVFGMGDGTSNVGLGILNTSSSFRNVDYRQLLKRWTAGMPKEWGFDEEHARGAVRGAALPMGFNRKPHYDRGVLLVGDAGGMVNPCKRRGHRVRDGVGRARCRDHCAGASQAGRAHARACVARLSEGTR